MDGYLKQSTASQTRWIGPFIDDTDFKTAKTALTIANTDIKVSKNGAASASKNSGGGTHDVNGMYAVTFDATDTATVGELAYSVKVAAALPVFGKFIVLEEVVYDALFAASAPGYLQPTTAGRTLDVSAGGEAGLDWANIGSPTTVQGLSGTTVKTATDVETDTQDIQGRLPAALTGAGNIKADALAVSGDATAADNAESFFDGTGYAGTNNVIPTVTTLTNAPADSSGVTTLLSRIPSGLFTGITSLAQWLGLIAGKQTGNTTARTELRATGAGSGTYDETTDSQEATRDNMGTAQTGDAYARLGAPAGASVSADVAAVKVDTAAILDDTGTAGVVVAAASKTGYTLSAAGVQAVWDALTSALTTVGSIGKRLVDNVDAAVSSRSTYAGADTSGTTTLLARLSSARAGYLDNLSAGAVALEASVQSVLSKLLKYVQLLARKDAAIATDNATELTAINADGGSGGGAYANTTDANEAIRDNMGTAQTGDAFARLGAPAGASVSADVAAVKVDTAAILDDTGTSGVVVAAASKTGYALSAAGVQAIWDALTSALTTVGSIGKLLVDNINATISSRAATGDAMTLTAGERTSIATAVWASATRTLTSFGTLAADVWAVATRVLTAGTNIVLAKGTGVTGFNDLDAAGVRSAVGLASADLDTQLAALPTAAENADAVWDEAIADHADAGSTGEALSDAGGSGTPPTVVEIRQEMDSNSTRLASIDGKTTNLPSDPADQSLIIAATNAIMSRLGAPVGADLSADIAALPAAVWASGTRTLTSFGTLVADVASAVWAATTRLLTAGTNIVLAKGTGVTGFNDPTAAATASAVRTELATELARVDAAISSRATPAQVASELNTYDAPTKAEFDAAVALLATVADLAALPSANANADALLDRTNAIETSLTLRGALRLIVAANAGKLSGAATSTVIIRNVGDSKDRIMATVDADGNRSVVTTDAT